MSTTEDLEARVSALEDERSILRLLHRYGHSIDYGLADAWLDCFTADGIFEVLRANPAGATYSGRDELRGFISQHSHAPDKWHKHVIVDSLIEQDGDTAEVDSYFMRLDRIDDVPEVRTFGRYLDRLRREPDGRWLIAHRRVEVEARRV